MQYLAESLIKWDLSNVTTGDTIYDIVRLGLASALDV